MKTPLISYSKAEERANTISHGVGFVVGLVAVVVMAIQAWSNLTFMGNLGVWIYGISLLCALGTSTLYHATVERRLKLFFKKLDHISIYLLISGSYTIMILNRMLTTEGMWFLTALWGLSIIGIWFKARYVHRFKLLSTVIYVVMGYVFFFNPTAFYHSLKPETIQILTVCGGFYSVGVVFYLWKSQKWTHFTWHLFVLAGASLHFYAAYQELLLG